MNKSKGFLMSIVLMITLLITACDKNDDVNDNELSQTDREFVMMASMSNFAEVTAGAVAAQKSNNNGIALFGEMMMTEHSAAGSDLAALASGVGLTVKDSLDDAHVKLMDTLAATSGFVFDSVYINSQVSDHVKTIALFNNEANNGQHKDLRAFAEDLLPHLQMHLQHADSLRMVLQNP